MRKREFGVDSYIHVVKRGGRGQAIVRDEDDRWRFLRLLRYLNNEVTPNNWPQQVRHLKGENFLSWPVSWSEQRKLVEICSFCLMPNHFHLLLYEIQDKGTARFMQKLCNSMSARFNEKYREQGSIFQGPYHATAIERDQHLQAALVYINIKNPFELYPGGLEQALEKYDNAYSFAEAYPFCSLSTFSNDAPSRIISPSIKSALCAPGPEFKTYAKEAMFARREMLKMMEIDFE